MKVIVTGSSGLIGSEVVSFFDRMGHEIIGVDNNMRMDFFGPSGDTTWNLNRLKAEAKNFRSYAIDIRDRPEIMKLFRETGPSLVIHCAAQPSHDLAAKRPLDDFDVNAVGTVNLLEALRVEAPDAVFIFVSTNKVYGDVPNEIPMIEMDKRWDYANKEDYEGVTESCRLDRCLHSIFGASKVAADIMTQEYGRYYGLKTGTFRGGCLTGPSHSGVELHGFLSYLVKVAKEDREYTVFGYKAKQVRDNIHSIDVVRAFYEFYKNPRPGEVYNIGGCRANSLSMMEAIEMAEQYTGRKFKWKYDETNRVGDHICYISDMAKFRGHYPGWSLTKSLGDIYDEIFESA
ncbi:dTDP-glucose 4,6-dehydratase [hydrothermal vent metagenome]|uniref:dTDP-glucose 4,6-dehydratase n=1 Tax=hydrothermal vent metagenome TaxID=652676 RepID=A0A3B1CT23_9ZZZZ